MAFLFPSIILPVLLFLLLASFPHTIHAAETILKPGYSLSINQTIVSPNGIFALGFFNPNPSKYPSRYYLGIWYHNITDNSNNAVVWVADRENPLTDDTSGVVTLSTDGNLVIWSRNTGMAIWSTNSSAASNGTEATLSDEGNLALRLGGNVLWQSFDHPADTYLPNMKLNSYFKTGKTQHCVAWRASDDPSPGNFSFGTDPRTCFQAFIWKGSEPYWRSEVWNGTGIFTAPVDNPNSTSIYVQQITLDDEKATWWYTLTQNSISTLTRCVIQETGYMTMYSWDADSSSWFKQGSIPSTQSRPCEFYNRCGPNGVCDGEELTTPVCKCFTGYVPKNSMEWRAGNYSGGCVKKTPWDCSKGGSFVPYGRMKAPDKMTVVTNASQQECVANCSAACSCTAYAFANVISPGSSTRCLVWLGDMIDLVQNFTGNEQLYVRVAEADLGINSQNGGSSNKSNHLLAIILSVGACVILLLGTTCCFLRMRRHRRLWNYEQNVIRLGEFRSTPDSIGSDWGIIDAPFVEFVSILNATDDFAITNKLGEGGFGSVYKGKLQQGKEIAVKRLSKSSTQGFEEFKTEVELIARLQHTNLVKLLGWCLHQDEKILIYEYLSNKSLDKYLFDSCRSINLDWDKRFHIIEGIAQGLLYLHRYSRLRIIHRDLKTSNILLDSNMNPKISDFGLARIFGGNQMEAKTKRVVGTFGYMAPEYALNGRFSDKSDVFSFGVILLEIISGKRNAGSYLYNGSLNLLGYAWQVWEEERCSELVDPSMNCSFPVDEVAKCVQVGLLCVQDMANDRPTMDSIIYMLGNKNPVLPSPRRPAFTSERDANRVVASSSSNTSGAEPPYEFTMSTFEGR